MVADTSSFYGVLLSCVLQVEYAEAEAQTDPPEIDPFPPRTALVHWGEHEPPEQVYFPA